MVLAGKPIKLKVTKASTHAHASGSIALCVSGLIVDHPTTQWWADMRAQVRKYEKDHKAQVALARAKAEAEGVSVGQKRKAEGNGPEVRACVSCLHASLLARLVRTEGREGEGGHSV